MGGGYIIKSEDYTLTFGSLNSDAEFTKDRTIAI